MMFFCSFEGPYASYFFQDELFKDRATSKENVSSGRVTNSSERGSHEIHHSLLLEVGILQNLKICSLFSPVSLLSTFLSFWQLLSVELGCKPEEICDFELNVCDTQPSVIGGALKEFIFSGRLDNLCMSFCSLKVYGENLRNQKLVFMMQLMAACLYNYCCIHTQSIV